MKNNSFQSLEETKEVALEEAVKSGDIDLLNQVIKFFKPDIKYALSFENISLDVAKFLHSKGAEINDSALVQAVIDKNYELVEYLLQNGAVPNDIGWRVHDLIREADFKMLRLLVKYGYKCDDGSREIYYSQLFDIIKASLKD